MDKRMFRNFLKEVCAMLKSQKISIKGTADLLSINASSLYGYISDKPKRWCPDKEHNTIIEKIKTLIGEDKMVYILDKYNMVQSVTLDKQEENMIPEQSKNKTPKCNSPMEQTLKMMTNTHASIISEIEEMSKRLKMLGDKEKTLAEAIHAINKVQCIGAM